LDACNVTDVLTAAVEYGIEDLKKLYRFLQIYLDCGHSMRGSPGCHLIQQLRPQEDLSQLRRAKYPGCVQEQNIRGNDRRIPIICVTE